MLHPAKAGYDHSMPSLLLTSDPDLASGLRDALEAASPGPVVPCAEAAEALAELGTRFFDLAVLEDDAARDPQLDVLRRARKLAPSLPIVLILRERSRKRAAEALALGAMDWIVVEGMDPDHLPVVITAALERAALRRERAHQRRMERRELRTRALAEPLRGTAAELGIGIRTHLSCIVSEAADLRRWFLESSPAQEEAMRHVEEAFRPLHEELLELSDSVRALLALTDLVYRCVPAEELADRLKVMERRIGAPTAERLGLRHATIRSAPEPPARSSPGSGRDGSTHRRPPA